ncbi:hypothetical protein LEP1GSC049_3153 [Leptospira kirschneri serovar Cynopteri str. 3522 CT]|nr:hypothetical protein LEP1GSC064_0709 [Leptospira kirschneri serovar Grippotyphosa str. Moskva]EKR09271.1 hypothetical protein LEP1GSC122_0317 [Leptospira kirschneri serovar Valbuzzi str. 200702274]EMN05911.1 hypothetical protein LEP1GSC046_0234 [Leptospira kirschneri serovar Bim str. 1051]EMN26639.1 hypothetical protein LEP1GSC065_2697 [Leptospira kirschneri serovar Sokoine str. RM1]EPG50125.1 hypothetical protein LEP1GSC049_3153 [Leptospira kirschneri serovar Cynopteri str. 3522 CT]
MFDYNTLLTFKNPFIANRKKFEPKYNLEILNFKFRII